ncbi:MAG: LCP family protein [Actinomycetota bacterium]|nr:LCP family protein [Actinomycetota bacterium]
MKTTLKRGIGRTASENGRLNGHVVLPPAVVATVTRYRQPAPERRGFLRILLVTVIWLLLAALVVSAGLAGGLYLHLDASVEDIRATTPEVVRAQRSLDIAVAGEPATALVIGYDKRAGAEAEVNGARSDTVMLVRADPDLKAVTMLSFPRDLWVEIHCPGRGSFHGRINEAYSNCGVPGTLATVAKLTGLPINYLITVNFRGFKQVVSKLGGVWMDVDRRYFNDNTSGYRYATIDLQPGYQKLNGQQSLDYVRYRHTDSDLYRLARQQMFLKGFTTAITESFSATDVLKIVDVLRANVEVGQAGGGALSKKALVSYGLLAYELPGGHFFQARIDPTCFGADDVSQLTVDSSCIRRAVQDFVAPDVDAPEKATAVALGKRPKSTAPPPKETTVVVLNGNGVPGAAAETSYQLGQLGYVALTPPDNRPANAPNQRYVRSEIYFDPSQAGAEAAARKLAPLFDEQGAEPMPAAIAPMANSAMTLVVVGRRFGGSLASAPVDKTPARQPAAVVANPALTRPLLAAAQRQVRFGLMVPHVVERTSFLPQSSPIRVYRMAGHETVRLTFSTGASEYWGIQMVRWRAAPGLVGWNRALWIKGRKYELHYAGANLQKVVLRMPDGTSYWVVNTLMNSLSNETMLAIAKGLRPLNG